MKRLNNVTFCGLLRNTLKSVLRYSSKMTHMVMSVFMKIKRNIGYTDCSRLQELQELQDRMLLFVNGKGQADSFFPLVTAL
jgi:hypothetical protein